MFLRDWSFFITVVLFLGIPQAFVVSVITLKEHNIQSWKTHSNPVNTLYLSLMQEPYQKSSGIRRNSDGMARLLQQDDNVR